MAHFITTGSYTTKAIQGMVANPSDRAEAVKVLVESAGGQLVGFYLTTGEADFMAIVEIEDGGDMIPALIAAGASGTVSNLKTVRAFTSGEFMKMQKKAGAIAKAFAPKAAG
jgi:uncharacterized protein with GYD domain